jgi:3-hydroxyisobutyrate dehydrogenase-like beta-hydroxyacid dehydrogenase
MSVTVAVVAMGEMGSGVAARLVQRGARVRTSLQGRSASSARRAADAGVEVVDDDRALVAGADLVLSIVPPARAGELAERLRPAIAAAAPRPVFADLNAVAPRTVTAIAAPFLAQGLPFADGGILGGPPTREGYNPRIYVSGEGAAAVARLNDYGLDVRPFSTEVGAASAVKMAFAGCTKGANAVAVAMMLGAARAGVADVLWKEIEADRPGSLSGPARLLPMIFRKAWRWDGEMEEIARFLEPEAGASEIFHGAAALYRDLARDVAAGEGAERTALLEAFQDRVK